MFENANITPASMKKGEEPDTSDLNLILPLGGEEFSSSVALDEMRGVSAIALLRCENLRVDPLWIKVGNLRLYNLVNLPEWLRPHERMPLQSNGVCA